MAVEITVDVRMPLKAAQALQSVLIDVDCTCPRCGESGNGIMDMLWCEVCGQSLCHACALPVEDHYVCSHCGTKPEQEEVQRDDIH